MKKLLIGIILVIFIGGGALAYNFTKKPAPNAPGEFYTLRMG